MPELNIYIAEDAGIAAYLIIKGFNYLGPQPEFMDNTYYRFENPLSPEDKKMAEDIVEEFYANAPVNVMDYARALRFLGQVPS